MELRSQFMLLVWGQVPDRQTQNASPGAAFVIPAFHIGARPRFPNYLVTISYLDIGGTVLAFAKILDTQPSCRYPFPTQ